MGANAAVFVLTGAASLVPMQAASFASENDFQDLLAKFPALLAGDQIDSANPRRFVLIDCEYPIASEASEAGRWSLDHLFLDQDGVPTLVEVKRGMDTRIRRRTALLQRIGDLSGEAFKHEAIDRLPSVKLSALSGDRCMKLTLVLDDVVRKLRAEEK